MFDVDMDVAKIVFAKAALSFDRAGRWFCRAPVQTFSFQHTIDVVAVEMRQKVAKNEGQVIQWKAGRASHCADDDPFLLRYAPWQTF